MFTPAGWATLRAAVLLALPLAACSPGGPIAGGSRTAPPPAAPVPTVVLLETQAGTPVTAEAGDRVEVRLGAEDGRGWRFLGQTGAPVSFQGSLLESASEDGDPATPVQVFRFTTTAAGRSELRFARGDRSLTFLVDVR
jgi:hypothetical protein